MASILFIETNPVGLEVIKKAKQMKHEVYFVTADLDYYLKNKNLSEHALSVVDKIIKVSTTYDIEVLKKELLSELKNKKIDAVMTLNELHLNSASHIAEFFNVPALNAQVADLARNKYLTKKKLNENGLDNTEFYLVNCLSEAKIAAEQLKFPLIMKPINGTGSLYVKAIHDMDELIEHFEVSNSVKSFGRSIEKNENILLEEFKKGDLYSVETVTQDNHHEILGITKRALVGYPYFVESESIYPYKLESNLEENLRSKVKEILNLIGINFGFCHIEFLIDENDISFVELNPRLAGGVIPELIQLSNGIEIYEELINLYTTGKIQLQQRQSIGDEVITASLHFTTEEIGILEEVENWENIISRESVVKYDLLKNTGAKLNGLKSNFDRVGYVLLKSNSKQSVCSELSIIKDELSIKIK